MSNAYAVEKCENKGRLTSTSTCGQFDVEEANEPTAVAVGIAYLNRGLIYFSQIDINTVIINFTDARNSAHVRALSSHRDISARKTELLY